MFNQLFHSGGVEVTTGKDAGSRFPSLHRLFSWKGAGGLYRVFLKKVLHKRKENMQEKMHMTSYRKTSGNLPIGDESKADEKTS